MPREINASLFKGTDDERLQKAFEAWAAEPGSRIRLDKKNGEPAWNLTNTIVVNPASGYDRTSGTVEGARFWRTIEWHGEPGEPAFVFVSPKDVTFRGLTVKGAGIACTTPTSGSRLFFNGCRVEGTGKGTGFLFGGQGNADVCAILMVGCEAARFESGFKFIGPNNLDPYLAACIASECKIGFDLREGGSNALLCGVNGTGNQEHVVVNGGFQGEVMVQSAEHCGTVFRTGGDDAAGYGQSVPQRFRALSVRDCTGPWAVVNKAGVVELRADHVLGPNTVTYQNRSSTEDLQLVLESAAQKASVSGTGNVVQIGK